MKFVPKVLLVAALLLNTTIVNAAFVLENCIGADGSNCNGSVFDSFPTFTLYVSDGNRFQTTRYITTYTDTFASDTTINFDFIYRS